MDYKERDDDPTVTNELGGKQSYLKQDWSLLPIDGLDPVVDVLTEGAKRYGRDNWRKIPASDHFKHALRHLFYASHAWCCEDTPEAKTHITHCVCRCLFFLATM